MNLRKLVFPSSTESVSELTTDNLENKVKALFKNEPTIDIKVGDIVSFINISENATSYVWYFGDGEVSMEDNPTHIYEKAGIFKVILVSSKDEETDSLISTIKVSMHL